MGSRPSLKYNTKTNAWEVRGPGGKKSLSIGGDWIATGKEDHLDFKTSRSDKTIRLNSRDYTATASIIGFQSKPRAAVNMKDDIIGCELEPGINAGYWGKGVVALKASMRIRATSGSMTGEIRCVEANMGTDTGYAQIMAGPAYCYGAINNLHGTVTKGAYLIYATTHGGNKAWNGFAALPNDGNLAYIGSVGNAAEAYVKVLIGSTNYGLLAKAFD